MRHGVKALGRDNHLLRNKQRSKIWDPSGEGNHFAFPSRDFYRIGMVGVALFKVRHKVKPCFQSTCPLKYHDDSAIQTVLQYVMEPMKTPSNYIGKININKLSHAAEEMTIVARYFGKESGVRLRHMILSFQPEEGVNAHQAYFLAHEIAAYYGNEYQIIFAIHEDGVAPHIHFVMNTISLATGLKYRGRRDDYYRFQSHIKKVLRDYAGIKVLIVVKDE